MVRLLARVIGIGIETADMLVREIVSRRLRDRSAVARWYRTRTEGPSGPRKTTMIVALARKLLIALWRLVTTGEVPDGVALRPAP
jgi:transposase